MMHGAIDTHAHILDPHRFPYSADAAYRPSGQEIAPVERFLAVLDAHGIAGGVVVQPTSGYLFENAVTLDAVTRAAGRLRAVVRVDPTRARSDESLLDVEAVAGARLDLIGDGTHALDAPGNRRLLAALKERSKILVVQVEGDQLAAALPALLASGVAVCVDHCGRPDPRLGVNQPGFQALLALGREGHAVKLSGPFRFSHEAPPYRDVLPFVAALLDVFTPARCCWGSDWPYLRAEGRLDYGPGLRLLESWLPDAAARASVLCDTPRRLFAFSGDPQRR
jgi:predicted TIM-barrel fold metal-dependent hydrolase